MWIIGSGSMRLYRFPCGVKIKAQSISLSFDAQSISLSFHGFKMKPNVLEVDSFLCTTIFHRIRNRKLMNIWITFFF